MDSSTTLTTFMLQTPPTVRSVGLLGSWDNFSQEYPMEKDSRMGGGHWRGCHTFKNITCDGVVEDGSSGRDGGLKMGGKYWYYYHLDGDVEYHNPAEPSTSSCPFLPGQPVNVLEVPVELGSDGGRGRSGSASVVFSSAPAVRTMDPADKYVSPRAAPTPKLARLATSPASLSRLRSPSPSSSSSSSSRWSSRSGCSSPASTPSSATFARLFRKGTVSEPTSAVTAGPRGRRGCFGRDRAAEMEIGAPSLVKCTNPGLQCVPISTISSGRPACSAGSSRATSRETSPRRKYIATGSREASPLGMNRVDVGMDDVQGRHIDRVPSVGRSRAFSRLGHSVESVAAVKKETSPFPEFDEDDDFNFQEDVPAQTDQDDILDPVARGLAPAPSRSSPPLIACSPEPLHTSLATKPLPPSPTSASHPREVPSQSHFSMYSTTTAASSPGLDGDSFVSYPGSPTLSSTTESSRASRYSCRLSEIYGSESGLALSSWDEGEHSDGSENTAALRALNLYSDHSRKSSKRNAAYFGPSSLSSGFQGYSLPTEEHGSVTTLRKGSESAGTPGLTSNEMSNGTEVALPVTQRLSTLEEMLSELGYLGDMIAPN